MFPLSLSSRLGRPSKVERVVLNALVPQPRDGSAAGYSRLWRFPLSSVQAGLAFSGEADTPSTDARRVPQPGSATPATATTPGATTIFGCCSAAVPDASSWQIDWRFTETPYKLFDQPGGVGRGCGVGRSLGNGVGLGVAVGVTLGVGVEVGVGVGVTFGVAVAEGVGVGVGWGGN